MRERFGGSSAMKLISKLDEEEEDEFPQTEINVPSDLETLILDIFNSKS